MPELDRYIPGVPCWTDHASADPDGAAAFYGGLFGWDLEDAMPPDSPAKYFMGQLRGENVAAVGSQMGEGAPAAWSTYIWVDSADETAAKVRAAGGSVLSEPMDIFDSGRMAVFADPEGAVFGAWQPNQHRGATVVNEHGSVNFNGLHTRDLEGAKAFYGAVFGWEALPMGMWALPAYGDHLELLNPGTRARTREVGGPERFEEVVAAVTVIPDDQPDTPAHWDVTFGVNDADAIAAKAKELGGTVLAGPFDAPWIRGTVIRDPQGAIFNANQFVPENRDLGAPADSAATSS
jgi:predicted enzyme related to lactoylglutathione lyase